MLLSLLLGGSGYDGCERWLLSQGDQALWVSHWVLLEVVGVIATFVRRLLYLGSSCVYPKLAQQPIREEALLNGPLDPTNEWCAIAKITGIKLCEALRRQHGFDAISL